MLNNVGWIDVAAMKTSSYGDDEEEEDEDNAGIDCRVCFSAWGWRKGPKRKGLLFLWLQMEMMIV